jgi:lycopene cyclase domain-containing protein
VNVLYLTGLLLALAGMVVLDVRFRLFFRVAPLRASLVMLVGIAFFLVWDLAGIGLGVFFRGAPELLVGVQLAPELPVEELFFLALLCYSTMNLFAVLTRAVEGRFGRWER